MAESALVILVNLRARELFNQLSPRFLKHGRIVRPQYPPSKAKERAISTIASAVTSFDKLSRMPVEVGKRDFAKQEKVSV